MAFPTLDLGGIYPPIPTPFDGNERLDVRALTNHLSFLKDFALKGVVVLGSNGEAIHLKTHERMEILERVESHLPEGWQMIAGTGCPATAETIELTRQAATAGADAALVLPPHYYRARMTRTTLRRHYHTVADASEIPVLIYNMPACTGIDLDAETIAELADHPNIIGLKDSGGNVAKFGALHQRLGDEFQLLAGSASFLLPAMAVGAVGGVLALANVAPAQCVRIRDAFYEGNVDEAQALQIRLIEANQAVTRRWGVAGLKAAMGLQGRSGGRVRAPLCELEPDEIHALKAILAESGLV